MGVLPFIQVLLVGYLQIPAPASAFLVSGIPLFQLYPSRQSIAVLSAGGNTAPVTSPFQPHLQSFSSSERPSLLRIERQHPLSPAGLGYSFAQPPYLRKTQMQTKSRGWTRLSAAGSATWHSSSATSNEKATWEKFDYRSHWYPVSWARDLPLHKPTKVCLAMGEMGLPAALFLWPPSLHPFLLSQVSLCFLCSPPLL